MSSDLLLAPPRPTDTAVPESQQREGVGPQAPSPSSVRDGRDLSPRPSRTTGPFTDNAHRIRYFVVLGVLGVAAIIVIGLILTWGNKFEFLSDKWWRVTALRFAAVAVIGIVTFAQSLATVTFQTVTNNRILTPSIMGFESLFILIQTAAVYFFGSAAGASLNSVARFLLQAAMMVVFAVLLYSWLLSGRLGSLNVMLLVGIVIGTGLGAFSTFMQRMLDPNEFDVLRARLFANIGNANTDLVPAAIVLCALAGGALWLLGRRLNVLALGVPTATNLGLNPKRQTMLMLTLIAVLMATSTSLVGPMTFLGFLVATLAYSLADTHDHRRIFPVAWLSGIVVLGGAYFLLKHVFPMVDAVMIIVELVGGLTFLLVVLRRGRL